MATARASLTTPGSALRLRPRRALSSAQVIAYRSVFSRIRQPPVNGLLRAAPFCDPSPRPVCDRGQPKISASRPANLSAGAT